MATQILRGEHAARDGIAPAYIGEPLATIVTASEARTVARAMSIIERTARYASNEDVSDPYSAGQLLRLRIGGCEIEEFHALWLNAQHRLIASQKLFAGTLKETAVYPREVVKAALAHRAAAVIFGHNHPGGSPTPSAADWSLTHVLRDALRLIDVAVLDHIIVTPERALSMESYAQVVAFRTGQTVITPSGAWCSPPAPVAQPRSKRAKKVAVAA